MSYSVQIDLPAARHGDAYPPSPDGSGKIILGPILIDGAQPSLTLARVVMSFRKAGKIGSLDSSTTGIAITNATTWEAEIPAFESILVSSGVWSWDLAFYSTGETVPLTLYYGTIPVSADV
jgi:hypothetical protein